jgi:hypothetical protein
MRWKRPALWLPAWAVYFYVWYLVLSWESPTVTRIGFDIGGGTSTLRPDWLSELLIFFFWFLTLPFHPYPYSRW